MIFYNKSYCRSDEGAQLKGGEKMKIKTKVKAGDGGHLDPNG